MGEVPDSFSFRQTGVFQQEGGDKDQGAFSGLRQFCGGLTMTFPNTATVESDFSMVKWEKNNTHTSLTSLALAGIMKAKQFEFLKANFKR
jgi:hypothetical protein